MDYCVVANHTLAHRNHARLVEMLVCSDFLKGLVCKISQTEDTRMTESSVELVAIIQANSTVCSPSCQEPIHAHGLDRGLSFPFGVEGFELRQVRREGLFAQIVTTSRHPRMAQRFARRDPLIRV